MKAGSIPMNSCFSYKFALQIRIFSLFSCYFSFLCLSFTTYLNIDLTHLKSREAGKHEVVDACAKLGDSKGAAQWLRKAHEELFVSFVLLQHGVIFGVVFAGQNLVNHFGFF